MAVFLIAVVGLSLRVANSIDFYSSFTFFNKSEFEFSNLIFLSLTSSSAESTLSYFLSLSLGWQKYY